MNRNTGSAICFRHYSSSPIHFPDSANPDFIPNSNSWLFRLSNGISFNTDFQWEGCQKIQKVKLVTRLFAHKQTSTIWLGKSFVFPFIFWLSAAIAQLSSKIWLFWHMQYYDFAAISWISKDSLMFAWLHTHRWPVLRFHSFDHLLDKILEQMIPHFKAWMKL